MPRSSYAGGRSPYYSVFVFAGSKLGGFWVIAFVQALIAAWMLWLTLRVFARRPIAMPSPIFCWWPVSRS